MSNERLCVCGHNKGWHDKWPERECGICPCEYRPVLDWPDADGHWWCDKRDEVLQAAVIDTGVMVGAFNGWVYRNEFEEHHGPAQFTKCEPNPFEGK